MPSPPADELQLILSVVRTRMGQIDAVLGKLEVSVASLREYRQALVTEAVTGKLDILAEPA